MTIASHPGALEELAESPYHLQPEEVPARIRTLTGWIAVSTAIHFYGTPREFMRRDEDLLRESIATLGQVGKARCRHH